MSTQSVSQHYSQLPQSGEVYRIEHVPQDVLIQRYFLSFNDKRIWSDCASLQAMAKIRQKSLEEFFRCNNLVRCL